MRRLLKIIFFSIGLSFLLGQEGNPPELIMKDFTPSGRIEALVENIQYEEFLLVQLDLKNDSLFTLVNDKLPSLELFSGPASYHRIMANRHLTQIQSVLTEEFYSVINSNYQLMNNSREYWVDFKQGSETQGTWSEDDAIELTCSCLSGASDCVKLGWDDSWWNPLDYWGEAWYGYQPPYYQSIDEIRVTVRGAQCDDLPVWSETYMGLMNDNGNWSHDYELSIDYTDNEYIVGNVWSGGMLMPRIGSEDNYCIDHIKLEFFYSCEEPESPTNLLASDGEDCLMVNLNWTIASSGATSQTLYRDEQIISQLDAGDSTFEDWGAQTGVEHIYCIQTNNECGGSSMTCNPGSKKSSPLSTSIVNASDGDYSNQVQVNWIESEATDEYKIYRDGSWMGIISNSQTVYTDVIAENDVVYDYCIESVNECGSSEWTCDTGYSSTSQGDVNDDGTIDVLDVVIVIGIIIETHIPTDDELSAADINGDGIVDVLDIVILVNTIVGD
ncbi:MAG: hypothetical protein H8E85_01020 [Candidatus Marinimicrobia bacterium]|nr:hypothetical protein [Candidatus Neomarinimicrobiota bacterium]